MEEKIKDNILKLLKTKQFLAICIYIFFSSYLAGTEKYGENILETLAMEISNVTYIYLALFLSTIYLTFNMLKRLETNKFIVCNFKSRKEYAIYYYKNIISNYTIIFSIFSVLNIISLFLLNVKFINFDLYRIKYICYRYLLLYFLNGSFICLLTLLYSSMENKKKSFLYTLVLVFSTFAGFYLNYKGNFKFLTVVYNIQNQNIISVIYYCCIYILLSIIIIKNNTKKDL